VNLVIEMRRPRSMTLRPHTVEIDRQLLGNILRLVAELIEARPLESETLLQTVSRLSWVLFELVCREDSHHGD
jgi:hypothetical protein